MLGHDLLCVSVYFGTLPTMKAYVGHRRDVKLDLMCYRARAVPRPGTPMSMRKLSHFGGMCPESTNQDRVTSCIILAQTIQVL